MEHTTESKHHDMIFEMVGKLVETYTSTEHIHHDDEDDNESSS